MEQTNSTPAASDTPPKVTAKRKTTTTKKTATTTREHKPAGVKATERAVAKASKIHKAPPQREARPGDEPYTVTLTPRHAEWVERRARQSGRTTDSMLEKIVREGYAADPDNKAGASTNNAQNIDQVAEQNRGG